MAGGVQIGWSELPAAATAHPGTRRGRSGRSWSPGGWAGLRWPGRHDD